METDNSFPETLTLTQTQTLTLIPEDLVFDNILPRLPVKSLIRFKCVSKTWNNVISTPQFTNSHLQFSSSLFPHFLMETLDTVCTIPYNHRKILKEPAEFEHSLDYNFEVVGCCNGLICLYSFVENFEFEHSLDYNYTVENFFIVWNPATRQHRIIPSIPFHSQVDIFTRGFGYYQLGSFHDYKIVAGFEQQLWVFSLRVGHWKSVVFPSDGVRPFYFVQDIGLTSTGIHIDGTLYWSAFFGDRICVYSFSLIDEQFNQEGSILKPANLISRGVHNRLLVFRGCLSFKLDTMGSSEVFVMKKEGGTTSWQKLFSIPRISNFLCLDFSITGKCLVGQMHIDQEDELKLVDITLEDFEDSIGVELGYVESVHHYAESLVSPFTLM